MSPESAWVADWDLDWGRRQAQSEGHELDAEAQRLLQLARCYYERFGHPPSMRPWMRFLQQELDPAYDSVRLAMCIPAPSLRTLCRWAGLPKPPHCL